LKKLTLLEYSELAEVFAAIAVVISLVYVGIQLKTNTAAVQSASIQQVTNTSLSVLAEVTTNPDLARIRRIGDTDPSKLTADESYRYFMLQRQIWLTMQNVYLQRDLEVIGAKMWSTYQRMICRNLLQPGMVELWHYHSDVLDPGLVAFVEACTETVMNLPNFSD
jgi:hypothetical protein